MSRFRTEREERKDGENRRTKKLQLAHFVKYYYGEQIQNGEISVAWHAARKVKVIYIYIEGHLEK